MSLKRKADVLIAVTKMINNHHLKQIELLVSENQFNSAELLCKQLNEQHPHDAHLKQFLSQIYVKTGRTELAIDLLNQLFLQNTLNRPLCDYLAQLYGSIKKFDLASQCYQRYLQHSPQDADALYNLAFNQRHAGFFEEAVANYQLALKAKISQPEEVMLNMAVIYSDHLNKETQARDLLQQALLLNSNYVPAVFNLANLHEQLGDKHEAETLFKRVLAINPNHYQALARLADIVIFTDSGSPLIKRMQTALDQDDIELSEKIDLLYGLGKAFNDCQEYSQAFHYYQQANQLNRLEQIEYNPQAFASKIELIQDVFTESWYRKTHTNLSYQPVFICGMFRSGSTLVEQILAAHPALQPGGELEFFVRKVASDLSPFPEIVEHIDKVKCAELAQQYIQYIQQRFPGGGLVTDKRSDNFLYVGLILSLFPRAKIIFTERNPLDNCLSVYFQRLGQSMNYASDLSHIGHYYSQQQKLMAHWKSLFPDSVFVCKYDDLVKQPELNIRALLTFLRLDWAPDCLNFYRLDNSVKTASVWQVRQPLYVSSSGRWQNFKNDIPELIQSFRP